eukprot:CAMPEP_0176310104 /NCGR_PEP_ID=MMETSP0121_2-20121125/65424_1 /TAXON_ID=160619 /ORGANISM="Kryptoperidinium foliaceum, Strain CCMP 1326" /LENGTH=344 /DNA_ID=CAMNT_0017652031 /DNA_START=128 /DNA_END=1163 /DNA_ORIENTATION=-
MAETRAAHTLAVKAPTKQTGAPQRPIAKGFAAQTGVPPPALAAFAASELALVGSSRCTGAASLKRRLLLDSTLQRLIAPLVAEGSAVHVYASLLHNDSGVGMWKHVRKRAREDPALASVGAGELGAYLKGRIASTGACPAYGEVLRRPEDLGSLPERPRDLKKYPPWSTQTGKRLLRLWKSRERLWNATQASEVAMRRVYDLLLWVRDDSMWVAKFPSPSIFLSAPFASRSVWARSCRSFGGINDKVVVMGRSAAAPMLTLYSTFLAGDVAEPTKNSEEYMKRAARRAGLVLNYTSFDVLPEASAMIIGEPRNISVCALRLPWCGGHKLPHDFAGFCEDIAKKG